MPRVVSLPHTYSATLSSEMARISLVTPGAKVKIKKIDLEKPADTVLIERGGAWLTVAERFLTMDNKAALLEDIEKVRKAASSQPESSQSLTT